MSTRTPLIAGNWKMNKTATEGTELVKAVAAAVGIESAVQVVLCPPFTALSAVSAAAEGTHLAVGAQNMHDKANGAFTGEVSAAMLRDLHVGYVILGHSERRAIFGEDAALSASLKPILCVGELLSEREAGTTNDVVKRQVELGLAGVPAGKAEQVIIAYEPVWAIGTGKTATPAMAQEVHAFIRSLLVTQFGAESAARVRILYGGSMKPDNADALLAEHDIDGGLIGGASLEAKSFVELVQSAAKSLNR
jgi:triosephosphate isomerase (TIM)